MSRLQIWKYRQLFETQSVQGLYIVRVRGRKKVIIHHFMCIDFPWLIHALKLNREVDPRVVYLTGHAAVTQ